MTDSPSSRLLLRLMAAGGSTNTWGDLLDAALQLVDDAIAGMSTIALIGNYTLVRANFVTDEARSAILKLTGSVAANVTVPSVSKVYIVWNASTALQTITTGSGITATIQIGEIVLLVSDGVNVQRVFATDFGGKQITSVADPTSPQGVATKSYVDATAFAMDSGILPGQGGSAGQALTTNGTVAAWKQLTSADLSDTAARDAAALGRAVAMAVAL